VGGGFLFGRKNHECAVDIIAAEHPHGTLAQGIVGDNAEKGAVDPQVCQGQRDVGLAAAIAGLGGKLKQKEEIQE